MTKWILLYSLMASFTLFAKDKIIIGYNIVPPFIMQDKNGKAIGAANEYFRMVAKEMGIKASNIEFKYMPLARLHKSLKDNSIDAVSLLGPEGDRKYNILPEKNFGEFIPGVLVKKSFPHKIINRPEKLKGLTIGTKIGMPLTKTMDNKLYKMEYQGGKTPLQNSIKKMMKASKGNKSRLDGVYSASIYELVYMASEQGISDKVEKRILPDNTWPVYVVFSRNGAKKYKSSYEKALRAMQKKKPYANYVQEYIKKLTSK